MSELKKQRKPSILNGHYGPGQSLMTWIRYLEILPFKFGTPLSFSEEELSELKGTHLFQATQQQVHMATSFDVWLKNALTAWDLIFKYWGRYIFTLGRFMFLCFSEERWVHLSMKKWKLLLIRHYHLLNLREGNNLRPLMAENCWDLVRIVRIVECHMLYGW